MTMDRPRTDLGRERLQRAGRLLLNGLGVLAALVVGGVVAFWISQRWILGISSQAAPALETRDARRTEPVSFANGDITLAGELTLPPGEGPHPAMVVVHGSGRLRGDSYRSVAERFADRGFAVLVYDKRGVGLSTGDYTDIGPGNSEAALGDLASDALAGVALLRRHPAVDADRVGLLGFSQAGWIIPLASAGSSAVAFTVIVSGPTVTVGEEIYYSDLTGDDHGRRSELSDAEIARRLAAYPGPHGFDPLPSLRRLEVPGLWILGGSDRSIPIPETRAILDDLIANSGKEFTVEVFPDAGHGLRDHRGRRLEYFPVIDVWLRDTVGL